MTLPNPVVMGWESKLYYCLAGSASTPTWVEVPEVQTHTTDRTATESDVSVRAMGKWKAIARAIQSGDTNFDIPHVTGNTHTAALVAAWVSGALVGFCVSDIDMTVVGANVFTGDFVITNFKQKLDAKDNVVDSFTIKLTWPFTAAPTETVTSGS